MASKFDSKRVFWILINIGLVVLVVGMFGGIKALYKYGASLNPARTISVSAQGSTVVVPDIATVSFTALSVGSNPATIQESNTKIVNSAIEFIKAQGIDPKDIKTSQYSLYPKYEYDEKKRQSFISGYELRQSIEVKIRDFTKIASILSKLPQLGINEIGTLQFGVDDQDAYLNKAREEAFAKARVKADAMAEQNGVKVGRVVNFSESAGGYPYPYPIYAAAKGGFEMGGPMPTIEPGSQEVTVNVSVTYEIR